MSMKLSQYLQVKPGTELVVSIGSEAKVYSVPAGITRVQVRVVERPCANPDEHVISRPEIGAPTLTINSPAGDLTTRAQKAADDGLKPYEEFRDKMRDDV